MTATIGAVSGLVLRRGYTGFGYEDAAAVIKLLGKDPAAADKNEVVQSSGLGARSVTFEIEIDSSGNLATLQGLLMTATTFDPGDGSGSRNVTMISFKPRIFIWAGASPSAWLAEVTLRER